MEAPHRKGRVGQPLRPAGSMCAAGDAAPCGACRRKRARSFRFATWPRPLVRSQPCLSRSIWRLIGLQAIVAAGCARHRGLKRQTVSAQRRVRGSGETQEAIAALAEVIQRGEVGILGARRRAGGQLGQSFVVGRTPRVMVGRYCPPRGIAEPDPWASVGLEVRCSIRLSYGGGASIVAARAAAPTGEARSHSIAPCRRSPSGSWS